MLNIATVKSNEAQRITDSAGYTDNEDVYPVFKIEAQ